MPLTGMDGSTSKQLNDISSERSGMIHQNNRTSGGTRRRSGRRAVTTTSNGGIGNGVVSSTDRLHSSFERDPDYDRSLPYQIVNEEADGAAQSKMTTSMTTIGTTGLISSSELNRSNASKQLYNPKTDPIPAYSKQASGRKDDTAKNTDSKRKNRERTRRSRRRDDAESQPTKTPNLNQPDLNLRKLFNPDSDCDEVEGNQKGAERTAVSSRQRGRERRGRNGTGDIKPDGSHVNEDVNSFSRESGRIMLLKNPNSERSSSTYSKIAPQLDYYRETPNEIVQKVKAIYSQILFLEKKCSDSVGVISERASRNTVSEIDDRMWWEVVHLHEQLLEQDDDFMFTCHLANATPAILNLPKKYNIPSRMWKTGVFQVLDLLRGYLPVTFDPLVSFIYYAYTIMTRLLECMPDGQATWLEFLGDLARCRMAIDDDSEAREIWREQAFIWYTRCSYITPGVGRLYHHLAVTSESEAILDQLYYYAKRCEPMFF